MHGARRLRNASAAQHDRCTPAAVPRRGYWSALGPVARQSHTRPTELWHTQLSHRAGTRPAAPGRRVDALPRRPAAAPATASSGSVCAQCDPAAAAPHTAGRRQLFFDNEVNSLQPHLTGDAGGLHWPGAAAGGTSHPTARSGCSAASRRGPTSCPRTTAATGRARSSALTRTRSWRPSLSSTTAQTSMCTC